MRKTASIIVVFAVLFSSAAFGQRLPSPVIARYRVPDDLLIKIAKAEDARDAKPVIEMLKNVNTATRYRAALAAGRIGDEAAVGPLVELMKDASPEVRKMAAFALGEIESIKAADAILAALSDKQNPDPVRARLVEAAGKIAAANLGPANAPPDSRNPKVVELGEAVLDVLEAEDMKREKQSKETVRLGLTAALRSRPEGTDVVTALFLTNLDTSVRADAANTLARLRAKNANLALRAMLMSDDDPIARANAARALGAAEDKESLGILIDSAATDNDSRVRVSAIRSLALLRDPFAVERLLDHGEKLLAEFKKPQKAGGIPAEKNELLEIATVLGRLIPKANDHRTVQFLNAFREADRYRSPETEIALARVAPIRYVGEFRPLVEEFKSAAGNSKKFDGDWQKLSAIVQGIGSIGAIELPGEEGSRIKKDIPHLLRPLAKAAAQAEPAIDGAWIMAAPDILVAFSRYKSEDLGDVLRTALKNKDTFVRVAAAQLIAEFPSMPPLTDRPAESIPRSQNVEALMAAYEYSSKNDVMSNDATLAILDALSKADPSIRNWQSVFSAALGSADHLVRQKARSLFPKGTILMEFFPEGLSQSARSAELTRLDAYKGRGTKNGLILNKDADYRRALSRRNGTVKAVFTTQKGVFSIDLLPEDAPLTVDNFVKLARSGYFNGLEVHRVVPNFVMQDGDPRGDGSGGPGWSIRCEVNMVPYDRGVVGMALSGKDTGGSQWFVTHSPQPHLDGGYTVFGKVNETGMKVVDRIVRGDKILSVRIVGR
ncbi:MAG: peptidylprolyl isomerase [Pyrinomonadaceae bacterium]